MQEWNSKGKAQIGGEGVRAQWVEVIKKLHLTFQNDNFTFSIMLVTFINNIMNSINALFTHSLVLSAFRQNIQPCKKL